MDELTFLAAAQLQADLRSYAQPRRPPVSTPDARPDCPERIVPGVDGRKHDPRSVVSPCGLYSSAEMR